MRWEKSILQSSLNPLTYSESDSDTDSGHENEHADQTVISVMHPTRLGRTRRLTQRMNDLQS